MIGFAEEGDAVPAAAADGAVQNDGEAPETDSVTDAQNAAEEAAKNTDTNENA